MPRAVNQETGEAFVLQGGQWVPEPKPSARPTEGFLNNLRDPRRQTERAQKGEYIGGLAALANLMAGGKSAEQVIAERTSVRGKQTTPRQQDIEAQMQALEAKGKIYSPEWEALNKTAAEEEKQLAPKDEGISFRDVVQAVKEQPGATFAELVNAIGEDPEYLATPVGWEALGAKMALAAGKYGTKAAKAAKVAGGMAGAAGTAATIQAPISTAQELQRGGEFDAGRVAKETAMVAGAAPLMVGAGKGLVKGVKTAAALKAAPKETAKIITKPVKESVTRVDKVVDEPISVEHLLKEWEGEIAVGQRRSWQTAQDIKDAIKDPVRRAQMTHWIEGDKTIKLSKQEQAVAEEIVKGFESYEGILSREGITDMFIENYVPHTWRQGARTKGELMETLTGKGGVGMSTRSRHGKKRIIPTIREGMERGLVPVTEDIADIVKLYMDDIGRVVQNKRLVKSLGQEIDPQGNKLIMRSSKAPRSYVSIDHPSLKKGVMTRVGKKKMIVKEGVKVHPDIAPSLKFIFTNTDPGMIERGIMAANYAAKRMLVGFSGFHANALLESMLYTGSIPRPLQLIRGKTPALQMLRHGKAGDVVDEALRAGLKVGSIEDVGLDVLYAALQDMETLALKSAPKGTRKALAKSISLFSKGNKVFDTVLWDRIMTSGKLTAYTKTMETATLKNAKLHKKNPKKYPLLSKQQLSEQVAEYVNDAFGGLNWRRIAEGANTQTGRKILLELYKPDAMVGRKGMQLLLFAPDWTIANLRILKKALPGKLGGARSKIQRDLHRKYALRGAALFALGGSAIQMALTGKPIWENEIPTRVDLGDGRTMVFSKQFVEPYHWVSQPGKTALNKLGILPRWAAEQLVGKKYISPRYSPPMFPEDAKFWTEELPARIGHTAGKFVPISAQQLVEKGPAAAASGFLGHPVYGETKEMKRERKKAARRRKRGKKLWK